MSTLKVDDIIEATSGNSKVFMVRAWFNWQNSGSNSLLQAHNVSSVTDIAAGSFNATFSTAFSNNQYASAGMSHTNGGTEIPAIGFSTSSSNTNTTTQRNFSAEDVDAGYVDYIMNRIICVGDQ